MEAACQIELLGQKLRHRIEFTAWRAQSENDNAPAGGPAPFDTLREGLRRVQPKPLGEPGAVENGPDPRHGVFALRAEAARLRQVDAGAGEPRLELLNGVSQGALLGGAETLAATIK